MRILAFVICLGLLVKCSSKESHTLREDLQSLSPPLQIFKIKNDGTDTLITDRGIKVIVPKGAFMFRDGKSHSDSVTLHVIELFDKSEMILSGVTTTSNGNLIESFGMVNMRAISNGQDLVIKADKSLGVVLPITGDAKEADTFYGLQKGNLIDWQPALTILREESVAKFGKGQEQVSVKYFKISATGTIFEIPDSTSTYNRAATIEKDNLNYDTTMDSTFNFGIFRDYRTYEAGIPILVINRLGWINCDRFLNFPDSTLTSFSIQLEKFSQPEGYVLEGFNSVMSIQFDLNGRAQIERLPKNVETQIIIIDKINSDFRFAKHPIVIGSKPELILQTKSISKLNLEKEMEKIDN